MRAVSGYVIWTIKAHCIWYFNATSAHSSATKLYSKPCRFNGERQQRIADDSHPELTFYSNLSVDYIYAELWIIYMTN